MLNLPSSKINIIMLLLMSLTITKSKDISLLTVSNEDPLVPETSYLCDDADNTNIETGKTVTLCIHFYGLNTRLAFHLKVDDYSVISIGGAYKLVTSKPLQGGNRFVAQIGKHHSNYPVLFFKKTNEQSFIYPLFNLVFKVDKGVLTEVVWDNECYGCEARDLCFEDTVAKVFATPEDEQVTYSNCISPSVCDTETDDSFNCDPKFYITWSGTDKNGIHLKSTNLSMAKFKKYSIGSLYNSARGAFNSTMNTIKESWESVKDATQDIIG